jgi:FKBP-type peptidyl-prolyl cis-trans isomerase FkpA
MRCFFTFLVATLILSACKTYSEEDKIGFDNTIKKYIAKNNITIQKTSSGLYKKFLTKGDGQIVHFTDSVSVTYSGELINGEIFDNHTKPQTLPVRGLIAGWKEALVGSRIGDKWLLIIPPQLGYGQNKLDDIPMNSILVFEIKIEDVK